MSRVLDIEMGFDLVCPWCLIGLRNLQHAVADLRAEQADVQLGLTWHGVQLLPHAPANGWPFMDFYRKRLGGDEAVRRRQAQVSEAARSAGVTINYDRIDTMPNTGDAHRLLALAAELGSQQQRDALLENMLVGYFERGDDLGNGHTLLAYAKDCGFSEQQMAPVLEGANPYKSATAVSGVPYFAINGKIVATGAQPAPLLLAAMRAELALNHADATTPGAGQP
jgi:predicted DsbA family dithiol-disulfide isomerase